MQLLESARNSTSPQNLNERQNLNNKRGISELIEGINYANGSRGSVKDLERISFATDKSGVSSGIQKIFEVVRVDQNERHHNANRLSPFSNGGNLTANSIVGGHKHLSTGLFSASGRGGVRSSEGGDTNGQDNLNGLHNSLATSRITEQIAMIDEEEYNEFLKFKQLRKQLSGNSNDSNLML